MFLRHNLADCLTCLFIQPIFDKSTNRHLSRTYFHRMKTSQSNVNRSAHNVFFDDRSTHNVLFDVLAAIYMECHEGVSGLCHKTCLGNIILCFKEVGSIQTHTIPTHKQRCKT